MLENQKNDVLASFDQTISDLLWQSDAQDQQQHVTVRPPGMIDGGRGRSLAYLDGGGIHSDISCIVVQYYKPYRSDKPLL